MSSRASEIALNEKLTREVLFREIFDGYEDTFYIRSRKRKVLSHFEHILRNRFHTYDEKFIIYCFISLWKDGKVRHWNFKKAWDLNMYYIHVIYSDLYYHDIEEQQQAFWIV